MKDLMIILFDRIVLWPMPNMRSTSSSVLPIIIGNIAVYDI